MTITYREYFMEPVDTAQDRFDLYVMNTVKTGDRKGEPTKSIIGYGYNIESAIRMIIYEELAKKNDVVDLRTFRESFKKEFEEVKAFFRGMDMIK